MLFSVDRLCEHLIEIERSSSLIFATLSLYFKLSLQATVEAHDHIHQVDLNELEDKDVSLVLAIFDGESTA